MRFELFAAEAEGDVRVEVRAGIAGRYLVVRGRCVDTGRHGGLLKALLVLRGERVLEMRRGCERSNLVPCM